MKTAEQQWINLCRRIIAEGVWIENERTGKRCLTVINEDFEYDVGSGQFPLITTRKSYWKAAVAEILGYLKGYTNAYYFKALGAPTWLANANENKAWLENPNRKGDGDMGPVYGAQLHDFGGSGYNQLQKVYSNLKKGIDDRGEILQMWNPADFHKGCLRPCMYEHQFSLVEGTLHLNSTQRSVDVPLGLNFNQVQVFFLLYLMARITGHKPGKAYHKLINCHIYEDQLPFVKEQLEREPFAPPTFECINPNINTLDDVLGWVTPMDFEVKDYRCHRGIKYPFSV